MCLQAACAAVDTYLELADAPARQQQSLEQEEALLAAMSLEDQKKHKLKRKKVEPSSAKRLGESIHAHNGAPPPRQQLYLACSILDHLAALWWDVKSYLLPCTQLRDMKRKLIHSSRHNVIISFLVQEAQKRAKEEGRRQQEAGAATTNSKGEKDGPKRKASEKGREKDPDPDGAKLAAVEDPLGEAAKLLQRLRENSAGSLRTHLLSFEVQAPFWNLWSSLQCSALRQKRSPCSRAQLVTCRRTSSHTCRAQVLQLYSFKSIKSKQHSWADLHSCLQVPPLASGCI